MLQHAKSRASSPLSEGRGSKLFLVKKKPATGGFLLLCSRQESNLHQFLRREPSYPLNDESVSEWYTLRMKTLTCAQMGGMCEEAMSAETKEEMMGKGMEHLKEAHPEMYATVTAMPTDDPKMVEWAQTFDATWTAAPDA